MKFEKVFPLRKHLTLYHAQVFLLTYVSFTAIHACRKGYATSKNAMAIRFLAGKFGNLNSTNDVDLFLGQLDTIFMFLYAFGLFLFGFIGDRTNMKIMLVTAMSSSAFLTFLFGYVAVEMNIQNLWFYRIVWGLNGLSQSATWPANVAIMGNWFSNSSFIFGVWATNFAIGNILGSLIVASVISAGYKYGMFLNSLFLFIWAITIAICLVSHPSQIGLQNVEDNVIVTVQKQKPETSVDKTDAFSKNKQGISLFQAVLIPGVIQYSLCYACFKLVSYSFFFWLPAYLSQGLHWDDSIAGKLSTFYDIGAIFGGAIAGILSDIIGYHSIVMSIMAVLSVLSIFLYQSIGPYYLINAMLMFINGILVDGPTVILSTGVCVYLGRSESIGKNLKAISTVVGIVDGTASFSVSIGQFLVALVNKHFGWSYVFYFFISVELVGILSLLPLFISDVKKLMKN